MAIYVRIKDKQWPIKDVLHAHYPDLGFDRGKRGKRRMWPKGYWDMLANFLKPQIDDVEFVYNFPHRTGINVRIRYEDFVDDTN